MNKTRADAKTVKSSAQPSQGPAAAAPRRKRPLVLALAAILLAGWLVFLAVMAYGG